MTQKWQKYILILLLLAGALGVASTYMRLSETDDEIYHTSCGMQWWETGTYTMQPLHPPLARVVDATLPYWFRVEDRERQVEVHESQRETYLSRQLLSRLGVLPFYVFSCLLVYRWSRQLYGGVPALWSLALYVSLSTVTTNGGLATTDMVYTTMLIWSLLSAVNWLEKPSAKRSVELGASLGLALSSKFSTVVQWPVPMAIFLIVQMCVRYRKKEPILPIRMVHIKYGLALVVPVAVYAVAMVFRFSFDALWQGISDAKRLSSMGFSVWLYGPLNMTSVWYFFPVVFFFKTPLPFFAATIIGNARILMKRSATTVHQLFPLMAACAIMAVSMTSHINLGVRHVLALYPLLAIPAGYGISWLWERGDIRRALASVLMAWQLVGFIHAYPEHIAYFNELAGDHPEHITLDSDYDWGQAVIMLDEALHARGIESVYVCARKDVVWGASILLRARQLQCPDHAVSGWVAVARAYRLLHPDHFTWLGQPEAVQRIGKTMDLYYFP